MTEQLTTIRFIAPTKKTPGFLRRQLHGLRLQKQFRALKEAQARYNAAKEANDTEAMAAIESEPALDPDTMLGLFDGIIAHVLPFVMEPEDRDAAREALLECNQEEYELLMQKVNGGAEAEEAANDPTTSQEPASA